MVGASESPGRERHTTWLPLGPGFPVGLCYVVVQIDDPLRSYAGRGIQRQFGFVVVLDPRSIAPKGRQIDCRKPAS